MEHSIKGDLIAIELAFLEEADEIFTEDVGIYDASNRFTAFCKKIINYMKEFIAKLKIDIESSKQKQQQKERLRAMRADIVSGKVTGPIHFIDIKSLNTLFQKKSKKLERCLSNILQVKCNNQGDLQRLDSRIQDLYDELDNFDHDLEIAMKKKKKLSGDDAINFIDMCLSGKDVTYTAYNTMINQMQRFQATCQRKLDNKLMSASLKATYFRKYQGIIANFSNRISRSTRKACFMTVFMFS